MKYFELNRRESKKKPRAVNHGSIEVVTSFTRIAHRQEMSNLREIDKQLKQLQEFIKRLRDTLNKFAQLRVGFRDEQSYPDVPVVIIPNDFPLHAEDTLPIFFERLQKLKTQKDVTEQFGSPYCLIRHLESIATVNVFVDEFEMPHKVVRRTEGGFHWLARELRVALSGNEMPYQPWLWDSGPWSGFASCPGFSGKTTLIAKLARRELKDRGIAVVYSRNGREAAKMMKLILRRIDLPATCVVQTTGTRFRAQFCGDHPKTYDLRVCTPTSLRHQQRVDRIYVDDYWDFGEEYRDTLFDVMSCGIDVCGIGTPTGGFTFFGAKFGEYFPPWTKP